MSDVTSVGNGFVDFRTGSVWLSFPKSGFGNQLWSPERNCGKNPMVGSMWGTSYRETHCTLSVIPHGSGHLLMRMTEPNFPSRLSVLMQSPGHAHLIGTLCFAANRHGTLIFP